MTTLVICIAALITILVLGYFQYRSHREIKNLTALSVQLIDNGINLSDKLQSSVELTKLVDQRAVHSADMMRTRINIIESLEPEKIRHEVIAAYYGQSVREHLAELAEQVQDLQRFTCGEAGGQALDESIGNHAERIAHLNRCKGHR